MEGIAEEFLGCVEDELPWVDPQRLDAIPLGGLVFLEEGVWRTDLS